MSQAANYLLASLAVVTSLSSVLHAQDAMAVTFKQIHKEYLALKQAPTVAGLVQLDRRLRDLLPRYSWKRQPRVSTTYLEPAYREMGLTRALFDGDFLTYSGKLLADAHARDPQSPLRSHTLYSTIFSPGGEASNEVPSPALAEAYVREFPSGPFNIEAHLTLAYFYDDLFKVIRREETDRRVGYKYDCFVPSLTTQPLSAQRRAAQDKGLRFYERLVPMLPEVQAIKDGLAALRDGTTQGWHYCAD